MDIINSIILGIVQGITEFLPISSTAHVAIFERLLNYKISLEFELILNLGTVIATFLYFNKRFFKLFSNKENEVYKFYNIKISKLLIYTIIGTIPLSIIAFIFKDNLDSLVSAYKLIGLMMILVGLFLWASERYTKKIKDLKKMTLKDSIIIGLIQTTVLLRGTSRSGITIATGLFRGLKREDAAEFSFLLGLFSNGIAVIYGLIKIFTGKIEQLQIFPIIFGFLASLIFGFISMKFLIKYLKENSLMPFIVYRIIIGIAIILFLF